MLTKWRKVNNHNLIDQLASASDSDNSYIHYTTEDASDSDNSYIHYTTEDASDNSYIHESPYKIISNPYQILYHQIQRDMWWKKKSKKTLNA